MHLTLDAFCEHLCKSSRPNVEKALSILWYLDVGQPDVVRSAGELAKVLDEHHVGTPNQTALAEALRRSKLANESKGGFSLKAGSRRIIRGWWPDLEGIQPTINQAAGYLSEQLWSNSRGYIESVCRELNGSFYHGYYNAAAVMLRRLLETLIIEAYEYLGREAEIKDGAGNYLMLSDLADRACGEGGHKGINLGRDSKRALKEARNVGNWSAHGRRFIAHATDLTKLQGGVRFLVQELMHIAGLAKAR